MTRVPGICLAWSLGLVALAAPAAPEQPAADAPLTRHEFVAPQMGTLFRIVLFAPSAGDAQAAASAAFARVTELNRIMSDYDPNSELMRLTRNPPGTPATVSAELFDILEQSQELAGLSDGTFDVTLGPMVRLWRESRRTRRLPNEEARAAARRASGYEKLHLNATGRRVTLLAAGMQLDLGGIAKGYAADAALAVLVRRGFPRAMVAASGDIALGQAPPGAAGWTVRLAPFGPSAPESVTIVASGVGVSTSGDAEQAVVIDGVRYSHIIDPGTGLGLTTPVAVAVIAANATMSDCLATTCSVLAARDPQRITRCAGSVARVIVFRRDAPGPSGRTSFGAAPPGLHSIL